MSLGLKDSSTSEASRNLAVYENARRCPAIRAAGLHAVSGEADLVHLSVAFEAARSLFCGEVKADLLSAADTGRKEDIVNSLKAIDSKKMQTDD